MAATSDDLAAALASLQAELGAQRALIGSLSNRVSELHALVASGGVLPGGLPPPAPETVQPAAGAAPRTGSADSAGTAATGAAAPAGAPPATAAGADNPALAVAAAARPATAALRLANAAAMLPEYYLREHNGTIAARIVDAAGVFLSVRCGAPGGASAGSTAAAAAALAASLPDGTLLRVHLEREGGPTPSGRALCGALDRPPLLAGEEATVCNGCATFSDLRITDSTYNLIKKAPAVLVVTAPHAPWLQPAMSAPFRVLTKRSLSDKKSAPAHAGGARRPRGTGGADVAKTDAVEALPGLGSRSAQRLRTAGINDCGDLARRVLCDEAGVRRVLGDLSATSKHWRNITESIAHLVAEAQEEAPAAPAEKRRRRTPAADHAVAVAQQAQVAAQAAAHAMAQVAARSAQDYGWPLDAGGGASMPGHPGHLSVGSLLPPSGLFGLDGSRGGVGAGGTHQGLDAPPAGALTSYDSTMYATLAALLSRSNNNTNPGGSVHGGSSHNGGGAAAQQVHQAHAHAQQQAAMATAAALAAAGPPGMQQLPSAWLDAAAATAARGLGLGTAGSAGGTGGAYHFGPGGMGASLRAAAAAVAAAAGHGMPMQGYPGAQGQQQQQQQQQQQHAQQAAAAQPVSRLMPAPPPRLGVLVAAGALMASRAPLGSALVADAAAAAAASAPPGAGSGGSDGSGGRMSSAREQSAKGTVAALLRAADSEINQLSPKDGTS